MRWIRSGPARGLLRLARNYGLWRVAFRLGRWHFLTKPAIGGRIVGLRRV